MPLTARISVLECSLSGDLLPTSGQAFIAHHDISASTGDIAGKMGYCPQFDALFDYLTGREHLVMYSHIKVLHEYIYGGDVRGPRGCFSTT